MNAARTSGPTIPLRKISRLPEHLQSQGGDVTTECPPWLLGDDTAFAVYITEDNASLFATRGAVVFGTKCRMPDKGDIGLFFMKDGQFVVRYVVSTEDGKFVVLTFPTSTTNPKIRRETIKATDTTEIALMAGSRRL
jgi:hypothetical protein